MRYLAVVATVNDAAAICDHLQETVTADDEVHVLTVHPPDADTPDADRREALNVARVRLALPTVETEERHGTVATEVATAYDADVDEVLVGREAGAAELPGAASVTVVDVDADGPA